MKKNHQLLFISLTFILFSCQQELLMEEETNNAKVNVSYEKAKISIFEMGFDTTNIIFTNGYYTVENDILLPKYYLREFEENNNDSKIHLRQAYESRVSNVNGITIGFSSSPNGFTSNEWYNWKYALFSAIEEWNKVPGSAIKLIFTTSSNPDIIIKSEWLNSNTIARGQFPISGKPGSQILINPNHNEILSASKKIFTVVHELGHCLGFRHTNWRQLGESTANHIEGTPQTDNNSVMQGGEGAKNWSGFSSYDVLAIQKLYPEIGLPNPNYIKTLIGVNNTLYPNIPYNNDAGAIWQGIGSILQYEWSAVDWRIIPHPNDPDPSMSSVRFEALAPRLSSPCYVRIRARNSYGWGSWSNPIPVNVRY